MNQNLHTRNATVKHSNPENQQTPTFKHTVASDLPKASQKSSQETNKRNKGKTKAKCTYQIEMPRRKVDVAIQNHRQEKTLGFFTQKSKGKHRRKKKQKLSEKTQ